jgi:metal transporter CNNM
VWLCDFRGLDLVNLRVLSTSGSESEQKNATTVLKLLEKGRHWFVRLPSLAISYDADVMTHNRVLVVLLLSNVIVNESLPIFLDSVLGGGVSAVILSTTLIVLFGEVLPQAVCARYGLRIGAKCAPFVLALMYAEFPIAWPIAKLLDWLLGTSHGIAYKKAELKTFVGLHRHIGSDTLNEDEVTIISAVLELSDKPLSLIMTPIEFVYSLSADVKLDQAAVDEVTFSPTFLHRIFLLTKSLS